jgi:hypothetical protein
MGEFIYNSEFVDLTYSKSDLLVELIWKQNTNSEEFRTIYSFAVNFATKNKVQYFLSDMRNEGVVSLEDVKWLTKEVIAKAQDFGIKKIALVNEDDMIFSTIYAESVKKKLEKSAIHVQIFNDPISARSWLLFKN